MKKLLTTLLATSMILSTLVGCTAATGDKTQAQATTDTAKKLRIGVVQITEHPSLDTIRESFLTELAALGYDEKNVDFDLQNAQGDQSSLSTICKKFVGDQSDLIVAIATPTAQTAAATTTEIPVLFSAVTDPVAAKLVEDPSAPSANVTGTSDAIPVDRVLELCSKLTPNVKRIGFLYTSSEINSQVTAQKAMEKAKEMGYECKEMTISEASELQQAAESLAKDVDAIYTPIDNTIASAMQVLTKIGIDRKIPVYVGADSMVNDGGFATVGIDYTKLGKKTAEMAKDILEGKKISEIPVATLDEFATMINQTTAEAIGVTIPEELKSSAILIK